VRLRASVAKSDFGLCTRAARKLSAQGALFLCAGLFSLTGCKANSDETHGAATGNPAAVSAAATNAGQGGAADAPAGPKIPPCRRPTRNTSEFHTFRSEVGRCRKSPDRSRFRRSRFGSFR